MSKKTICLIGDTHGSWNRMFDKLDQNGVENAYLIHVGDLGMGFVSPHLQQGILQRSNEKFKERGIEFLAIRGNHDDPSYFTGSTKLSHIELLPDYTLRELNGEKFLFVGGAISIDRIFRTLNQSYWLDEPFVLKPELAQKCDVLITHTAPYWIGPFDKEGIESYCLKDTTLWDECYQERLALDELVKLCTPKKHYCGHFHQSAWVDFRDCYSRILDIEEIAEHRQ